MNTLRIAAADFDDPRITDLIRFHASSVQAQTAPGSAHAFDAHALQSADIQCWAAWDGDVLAGVAGLKRWSTMHGEVKAMHVAATMRKRGVGQALLRHIVGVARAAGLTRLSLQTGSWAPFAPAHRLYREFGFLDCEPFEDYVVDSNSRFFTLALSEEALSEEALSEEALSEENRLA